MPTALEKMKEELKSKRVASDYSGLQDLTTEERKDLADFMRAVNDSYDYEEAQMDLNKYTENKAWSRAGASRKKHAAKALKLYNEMATNPKYKDILPEYHGHDTRVQGGYTINVGKDAKGNEIKLKAWKNQSYERLQENVAKTKDEKQIDKFIEYEDIRLARSEQKMAETLSGGAFKKLGDTKGIQKRKVQLAEKADYGISKQDRAVSKARVGAAIRGQTRAVARRMQSMLSGQGVRPAAANLMMQNLQKKANKQAAGFSMSQMARSYSEKYKGQEQQAKMQVTVDTYDIGQDKSALEFKKSRDIFQKKQRSTIVNTLAAQGRTGLRGMEGVMESEKFITGSDPLRKDPSKVDQWKEEKGI